MQVREALKRHCLSLVYVTISGILFLAINRSGELPAAALDRYGFSASAPLIQWFYRTFTSDWLYLNAFHFWVCVIPLFVLLFLAELTHSRKFLFVFFISISFWDDFINYFLILKPFQYVRPELYHLMISEKDVGASLILSCLLGLEIVELDRYREIIFVLLSIFFVLGTVFTTNHYASLILNLNHFVFLCFGYFIGKLKIQKRKRRQRLDLL